MTTYTELNALTEAKLAEFMAEHDGNQACAYAALSGWLTATLSAALNIATIYGDDSLNKAVKNIVGL